MYVFDVRVELVQSGFPNCQVCRLHRDKDFFILLENGIRKK